MEGRRKKSPVFSVAGTLMALAVLSMPLTVAADIVVSPTNDAAVLVNNILGPGVSLVGTPTLTGVTNQQGAFTAGPIGFSEGIVLTSGNAANIPGPNVSTAETLSNGGSGSNSFSVNLGTGGYAALTTLAGYPTFNANVLSFSFQFGNGTSTNNNLYFNYVFASEEYIGYVNSSFNDVFGFFVDGVNIALVGGQPVNVNNINPVDNAAYYINNVANTNGYPVAGTNIKLDGYTTILTAQMLGLGAGTHTMTLALADASDSVLDSAVFIQKGSFSNEITPTPEPLTLLLLGMGLSGLAILRRK